MLSFKELIVYVSKLRVEPLMLLFITGMAINGITQNQLMQDKICLQSGQTADFCLHINDKENDNKTLSESEAEATKSAILAEVTNYSVGGAVLGLLPCLVWSMFVGSFVDKRPECHRYLMAFACFGATLHSALLLGNAIGFRFHPIWVLVSSLANVVFGGQSVLFMVILAHITAVVIEEGRTVRFAILETAAFIGMPLGTFLGGAIISTPPVGGSGQLHNYEWVFGTSVIINGLALIWVLVIQLEKPRTERAPPVQDVNQEVQGVSQVSPTSLQGVQNQTGNGLTETGNGLPGNTKPEVQKSKVTSGLRSLPVYIKEIFDFKNVKEMFHCCFRKRENGARLRIWLVIVAIAVSSLVSQSGSAVMFQFVQKAYHWDARFYSYVNSIMAVASAVIAASAVVVFTKFLKWSNNTASLVSVVATIVGLVIRGAVFTDVAAFASYLLESLKIIPLMTARADLTTIIDQAETGKVFCVVSTFDAIVPTASAMVFGMIFSNTIDSFLGTAFLVAAAVSVVPFLIFVWLALKKRPVATEDTEKNSC